MNCSPKWMQNSPPPAKRILNLKVKQALSLLRGATPIPIGYYYKVEGGGYCPSCPHRPLDERNELVKKHMEEEATEA